MKLNRPLMSVVPLIEPLPGTETVTALSLLGAPFSITVTAIDSDGPAGKTFVALGPSKPMTKLLMQT
ncbi:hypothetical protein [Paracidovorax anthurii]|uniref:hypothetical protein n=1 Tax=Paracidovorax anthurii TaxID=78229 RepID=UPI00147298BE|nr:hypothetical protein [Paracidovorax anthurii]